jgi:hypothetical protein
MLYFKFKLLPSFVSKEGTLKGGLSYGKRLSGLFYFLIEIPLHFVVLYTFAFFPFLVGPTQMMFGKSHVYKVVKKF